MIWIIFFLIASAFAHPGHGPHRHTSRGVVQIYVDVGRPVPLALPADDHTVRVQLTHRVEPYEAVAPEQRVYQPGHGECVLMTQPPTWAGMESAFVVYNNTAKPAEVTINGRQITVYASNGSEYSVLAQGAHPEISAVPPALNGTKTACYGLAPGASQTRWSWTARELPLIGTEDCADPGNPADTICKIYRVGDVVESHNPYNQDSSRDKSGAMILQIR